MKHWFGMLLVVGSLGLGCRSSNGTTAAAMENVGLPVDLDAIAAYGPYLDGIVDIATGYYTTCAVHEDGHVSCWGRAWLTGGEEEAVPLPARVEGISDAVSVAVTLDSACAVTRDQTVSCWGSEYLFGERGDDLRYVSPRKIDGLEGVLQITGKHSFYCVRTVSGEVACFGDNPFAGADPDDTDPTAARWLEGVSGAVDVTVTSAIALCSVLVRDESGAVECLLANDDDDGPAGVRRRMLASGVSQMDGTCMVRDGRVACFGGNTTGKLGRPRDELRSSEEVLDIAGVQGASLVSPGEYHVCAVNDAGTSCWGENNAGQLGADYRSADVLTPVPLPLVQRVTKLTAGDGHTCALLETSEVVCWGRGSFGQIGNGRTVDALVPTPVRAE